jgi:hypothetical protein
MGFSATGCIGGQAAVGGTPTRHWISAVRAKEYGQVPARRARIVSIAPDVHRAIRSPHTSKQQRNNRNVLHHRLVVYPCDNEQQAQAPCVSERARVNVGRAHLKVFDGVAKCNRWPILEKERALPCIKPGPLKKKRKRAAYIWQIATKLGGWVTILFAFFCIALSVFIKKMSKRFYKKVEGK